MASADQDIRCVQGVDSKGASAQIWHFVARTRLRQHTGKFIIGAGLIDLAKVCTTFRLGQECAEELP